MTKQQLIANGLTPGQILHIGKYFNLAFSISIVNFVPVQNFTWYSFFLKANYLKLSLQEAILVIYAPKQNKI